MARKLGLKPSAPAKTSLRWIPITCFTPCSANSSRACATPTPPPRISANPSNWPKSNPSKPSSPNALKPAKNWLAKLRRHFRAPSFHLQRRNHLRDTLGVVGQQHGFADIGRVARCPGKRHATTCRIDRNAQGGKVRI